MAICLAFFGLTAKSYALLPPIILVQPLGVSVQNGGTAVLTVAATSVTPQTFIWRLNGHPISTNNSVLVTGGYTNMLVGGILSLVPLSTLTIKNIASTNAGNYSVQIQNGTGSVISDNATVVVLTSTVSNVVNIVTTGLAKTASGFTFQLSGPVGSNVVVEATSDLVHWTPIATNYLSSSTVPFTDATATNYPFRYYRARIL